MLLTVLMRDAFMCVFFRLLLVLRVKWQAIAMLPKPRDVAARALLWAFGIPFVLLVTTLVIVLWQTGDEGIAALSALLSLIPYYGLLYLMRHRMQRQMAFTIE